MFIFRKKLSLEEIGFNKGFLEAFYEKYQEVTKRHYGNNPALDVLFKKNIGKELIITGSNPYAVILSNQIMKSVENLSNIRTSTQLEFHYVLSKYPFDLPKVYIESDLILRKVSDENKQYSEYFKKELDKIGIKLPARIPLQGLYIENNAKFPYEIEIKFSDNLDSKYKPVHTPVFNQKGQFNNFDLQGNPIILKENIFYNPLTISFNQVNDAGLVRLIRNDERDLFSIQTDLTESDGRGRIIFVDQTYTQTQNQQKDKNTNHNIKFKVKNITLV
ncbi:MAG: hypothetical protein QXI33_03580 [Candidatus Pacearchaeota archaeon]